MLTLLRHNNALFRTSVLWGVCVCVLLGCTVQLAPDYEEIIVQGLKEYNDALMTHMVSVRGGTEPGLESDERKVYDRLKGQGDSLIMLVKVRPEPHPAFLRWLGRSAADDIGDDGAADDVSFLEVPTGDQIEGILAQLNEMRRKDRDSGLNPGEYQLYKNAIDIYMRNALTYEMALKR